MSTLFQHSNETLLLIIADMLGKDVTLTLVGNVKYSGILSACSQDLALGLRYAYKVTEANRHNLLPVKSQVHDKMIFPFKDIVDVTTYITEPKVGTKAMSFATDRDYHGGVRNGASSGSSAPKNHNDDRLEEWTGEDDEGLGSIDDHDNIAHDLPDQRNRCGPGWSVEEMFAANKEKVVSTFKDDLTQYTTVAVEGTEEDRARADRLAREIEQNQSSKFYARLENDDIERDLDKETGEDDFETVGNRRKGFQNKSNNHQRSNNNSSNLNTSTNRRAEALKGGNNSDNRRNSGGGANNNQQQRYSGNNNSRRNDESFADKSSTQQKSQNYPQKQMLDSRQNQSINKPSEEERRAGKNSIITSLKNFGNEFELKGGEQQAVTQAAGAWNSGPPKSLLAKGNEQLGGGGGASTSEHQEKREPIENSASTSAPIETANTNNYNKNNNTKLNDSAEQGSENESNTMTPSTADVSDASSTTGGVSKSTSSFKFNVNAPEFVPTGAAKSTTPQPPGTPTGSVGGGYSTTSYGPQFGGPQDYPQGGPPMMQGQPMMVWQGGNGPQQGAGPQGGPQQYGPQYQYVQLQAQPGAQRAQGQGQIYAQPPQPGARNPQQNAQQRMYWPQPVIMPQPIGYFNPQAAAATQNAPQGFTQGYPQGGGGYAGNGASGGRGGNYQQQMYMMQNQRGGYPQQQQQEQGGAPYQSGPQSHPNSQPTTPGPQQQQGNNNNGQGGGQQGNQQQQHPQPVPSPGQSITGSNLRHGGAESGSQGSLAGSGSQTRSGSPQPNNAPPIPPQHQMPPPQIAPQQFAAAAAAAMHVPPPHPAQIHPGHHPMQHHPGAPQPYYHHHPQQACYFPIYYQQVYPQQPHGIPMQQGPHGVGPHHPGQMMVDQQHMMEQQHQQHHHQSMQHPQQQQQQPFVVDQYNMYQNGPTYYQPPHGPSMSRQNSMPHQQFAGNNRNNEGGSGGSQAGSQSGSAGPQN
ncbi:unnamed protein product [Caenorhabditis angaria]|uniref:LsmAD domain-containing protein n=1 Tax=Caenorhabditis angaria TaxID=860376 RepID=A0A9P1IGX3_9PELO|nr:unnamed protein product [Caenorhabditis angaria]